MNAQNDWKAYVERAKAAGLDAEKDLPSAHTSSAPAGLASLMNEQSPDDSSEA